MEDPARRRSAMLTVLVVVLLGLVLYAVAILVAPSERSDGVCEGIGFGCSPAPRDTLLLLAVFGLLPMLVSMVVSCTVGVMVLLRLTRLPGVAVGLVAAIGGALVGAVVTWGVLMLL